MSRSPRQVVIADHLWEAFGRLAEEMGSDRDGLVNEALHAFARRHGHLAPGDGVPPASIGPGNGAPDRRTVAALVLETAEQLERDITESDLSMPKRLGLLRLELGGRPAREVAKKRFVIGRGVHCDLQINSARISREHAAVLREADGWWIEDLGSSNGTWFEGERISRRRIADGDEYFLCSEKVRCELR